MEYTDAFFNRSERILGEKGMQCLKNARIIIFGIGGVGSWCAESLIRTGLTHLTIVDADCVAPSNINRQLMATVHTIGIPKVEALKTRLLAINPNADIEIRQEIFCEETAAGFNLDSYDYIVDAIDSLKDKLLLIEKATRTEAKFFSSMGAALKVNPTKIRVAEFSKVIGCPLARALRDRFKKLKRWPAKKFLCVYSDELVPNIEVDSPEENVSFKKSRINGSLMHITAIFGLTIAGFIIDQIYNISRGQN